MNINDDDEEEEEEAAAGEKVLSFCFDRPLSSPSGGTE